MNKEIFKNPGSYWEVAEVVQTLYTSDGSMNILLDFERVLDTLNVYAFRNWSLGELVEGPEIAKYTVACTFLWPEHMMPDPRAGKRLLSFGCTVSYYKTKMKVPKKIEEPDDYREEGKKAKLIEKSVWLVEVTMPKNILNDIRQGAVEVAGEEIELSELDMAYDLNLDDEAITDTADEEFGDEFGDQGFGDETDEDEFGF